MNSSHKSNDGTVIGPNFFGVPLFTFSLCWAVQVIFGAGVATIMSSKVSGGPGAGALAFAEPAAARFQEVGAGVMTASSRTAWARVLCLGVVIDNSVPINRQNLSE